MEMANENPGALIPELALLVGAVLGLVTGLFVPRRRQWIVAVIAAVSLLVAVAAAGVDLARGEQRVFDDTYAVDTALGVVRIVVAVATLLVLGLSVERFRGHRREAEVYVLLLFASLGTILMAGAADLMLVIVGYLLASLPLYTLTGLERTVRGTEAALKYFLLGAFLGVLMLFGFTLLYGAGGATGYSALAEGLAGAPPALMAVGLVLGLAGLGFKLGAAPLHFWVPDVTDGAPSPVAAYVTTLPKIGALVATTRLLTEAVPAERVDWPLLVAVLAAASMTLGNLAAFWQTSVKRLLAYSTISQVGYLLMAVAVAERSDLALPALLFYVAAYAAMNLGAFAVVAELRRARALSDYAGLARRHRGLAFALLVCLLSLIGVPPLGGFVGKLAVFVAAIDGGMTWLVVVAAVNTVASVFYYVRWIAPVYLQRPPEAGTDLSPEHEEDRLVTVGSWSSRVAYLAAAMTVALGIAAGAVFAVTGPSTLGG
jgi:NADH-quinone oxidoreductase subunit N